MLHPVLPIKPPTTTLSGNITVDDESHSHSWSRVVKAVAGGTDARSTLACTTIGACWNTKPIPAAKRNEKPFTCDLRLALVLLSPSRLLLLTLGCPSSRQITVQIRVQ